MNAPSAVVFDVDGTLADTERDGHRVAFNRAFAEHGVDLHWDEDYYGRLLTITGGRQRIAADLRRRGVAGEEADDVAARVHATKTRLFAAHARSGTLPPRPGVAALVEDLRSRGVTIAVATTGRREWAEPLIRNLLGPEPIGTAVYGDDVDRLKPDPQAYKLALRRLGLPPCMAVAVEDSGPGLRAARGAGLATLVVTNDYTRDHDLTGAAMVRESFDRPSPLTAACLGSLLCPVRG
ncbi:HAD-IA family hydrolase [Pseudonocardia endophytica]|uniref:HAD superfamily hydrolase (TIGR01509 family) n=1 Tax=Pseudonocardia endophytica TaxID=401976 RepID=A0A4R1HM72_PSEEN|nr:HAD-IA family hydrolase [Pseudonocardia endophytica]TCK20749.1 HAD superfamily hydrolase (TIGR01509 family) [Pseudonocardia endophytica]